MAGKASGWDASDGRNGGAARKVWGSLLETERFDFRTGEKDQGANTLVLDLAYAFERVNQAQLFGLWRRISIYGCHAGHLEHRTLHTITPVDMELSHCASRRAERIRECVSASEAEGFRCGITAFVEGRDKWLPGIAEKILKSIMKEVEEKGPRLSITEGGMEGKFKVVASCS